MIADGLMKKCLFTFRFGDMDRFLSDLPAMLRAHEIELIVSLLGRNHTEDELIASLTDVDAVIAGVDPFTPRVMDAAKKLKIIARAGVGFDNVDLAAATKRGIYVTWTPIPELGKAVADETFTLILSTLRRVPQLDRHIREGGYDTEKMASLVSDAFPLTLGIIGLGKIGVEVARRARGFEMKVLYHDQIRRQDLEKEWNIRFSTLDELLSNSDIVTIHTNLTPETKRLIGKREMAIMKDNAIIINTARGPIIDEEQLFDALVQGKLGGAGLSVFSEEPPTSRCRFYKLGERLPNVILLPHIGPGVSVRRRLALTAAKDVIEVLEGRQPKYLLNKDLLTARTS